MITLTKVLHTPIAVNKTIFRWSCCFLFLLLLFLSINGLSWEEYAPFLVIALPCLFGVAYAGGWVIAAIVRAVCILTGWVYQRPGIGETTGGQLTTQGMIARNPDIRIYVVGLHALTLFGVFALGKLIKYNYEWIVAHVSGLMDWFVSDYYVLDQGPNFIITATLFLVGDYYLLSRVNPRLVRKMIIFFFILVLFWPSIICYVGCLSVPIMWLVGCLLFVRFLRFRKQKESRR